MKIINLKICTPAATFAAMMALSTTYQASAQGTAFTYQGRLMDGGTNANGNYDLRFYLRDALNLGNPVGNTNTLAPVAVSNGLFTVTLDFGAGIFTGSPRWLEIGVRTNGSVSAYTTLGPRQPLTATPYALYATNAAIATTANAVAPGAVTGAGIQSGQVVKSLNGLMDNVTLSAGPNVTLTPSGNSLQISASGSPASGWALGGNGGTTTANFLGTTDPQALVLKANNVRLLKLDPNSGAPNLLGGAPGNFISAGVEGATLAGGGTFGTLGGSYTNTIMASYSTIGGGLGNLITAGAYESTIAGGNQNTVESNDATVGGGVINHARGSSSTVGGGYNNTASGGAAAIAGGSANVASGDASIIGGGQQNIATGLDATIGGGTHNTASGEASSVGGGDYNTASGVLSTIAGGDVNFATNQASTVGGGTVNKAHGYASTVAGGFGNMAVSIASAIGGGGQNVSSGNYSVIPGGYQNWAPGPFSLAAGRRAKAINSGTFVWADSTDADFGDSGANTFNIRSGGGASFVTAQDALRLFGWQPFLTFFDSNAGNARGRIQSADGNLSLYPESYLSGSNPNSYVTVATSGDVSVSTLTIRGGADLAEPFEFTEDGLAKGSVVIIDPENPGKLKLSDQPYDHRVAGIVSGANGINPGIALHQNGTFERGQNVALSGRVYVLADASNASIRPGDLLTTSDTPGHAMKVTESSKAQGAIIGKAMSTLREGKGMVLVLVSLQ